MPANISTLVGAGSSICGGSVIVATAPVTAAGDEEAIQAISVIFLFNILAAILSPWLGTLLHFHGSEGFGMLANTTVDDASSVTATATTQDSMSHLDSAILDKTVAVELTRTPATIPITLFLDVQRMQKGEQEEKREGRKFTWKQVFLVFILYSLTTSVIMTVSTSVLHISPGVFLPLKELSELFIIMAIGTVGLHTDIVKLVKNGDKPIFIGFYRWVSITLIFLLMQRLLDTW